ncbi:MAG: MATE family efflux transporter [Synergistaceae bacterium]|jgi:putative MATE family efflux protein|nr:MATE family efflux transporter [Synergistaceae bacterium]
MSTDAENLVRDFRKGSIPKTLLVFMLPFMASNVFQVLYSTVDMIVVGRCVGSAGLAAVSLGSQVLNFATMLCTGYCTGGQVLISQLIGAERRKELNGVIGTLFASTLILGVAFSAGIVSLHLPLLRVLNMPLESFNMAVDYLTICGVGLIFTFGYNMVSSVLRGMGDSKHPFLFILLASVLNLILDLLFTGYLGWGVAGAAAATILGQAVSFLFSLVFLYRRRAAFFFDFRPRSWKIRWMYFNPIVKQGVPLAIHTSAIHISMFYVNSLVNQVGVIASATFGVGIKLDDICTKISIGIRYAAGPMIAQNYAARALDRAKSVVYWSWIFACAFHGIFIVIYLLFGRQAFALFTTDADVLDLAPVFISAIMWTFMPLAIMRGTNAFVQGIGNAPLGMLFGLLDAVIMRVGLSYVMGVLAGWGFYGFVLGYGLAPYGAAIPGAIYFLSGMWKKRKSLIDDLIDDL